MGYRAAVLQPSPKGLGVYRRLGFRQLCAVDHFCWKSPQDEGRCRLPMIRVRDIDMHYEVHGRLDAEPLVLLHGFTGTGQVFDPFLGPLSERCRVIVPDWRGHGRTTNPRGEIIHAELAGDTAAFVAGLGLDRAHFCGFSSGAIQLLFLALEQPSLIHSLTLAAGGYAFDDHVKAQMREVVASVTPEGIQALEAAHGGAHGAGYGRILMDRWAEAVFRPGELSFAPKDLGEIACPTLIVHGDRDRFFPVRVPVAMYGAIPNAELCILPRCGHSVPRDRPALWVKAVLNFLERNPFVNAGG